MLSCPACSSPATLPLPGRPAGTAATCLCGRVLAMISGGSWQVVLAVEPPWTENSVELVLWSGGSPRLQAFNEWRREPWIPRPVRDALDPARDLSSVRLDGDLALEAYLAVAGQAVSRLVLGS